MAVTKCFFERLQQITANLIACKAEAPEGYIVTIEPELKLFIDREFEASTLALTDIPKVSFNVEPLDAFFRKIISTKVDYSAN